MWRWTEDSDGRLSRQRLRVRRSRWVSWKAWSRDCAWNGEGTEEETGSLVVATVEVVEPEKKGLSLELLLEVVDVLP